MSKPKTKEEVITHKKQAIRKINNLCEKYIASDDPTLLKKVDLLSHWFEEYAKYIEYEDSFDSNRLIRYKRGNVIRVNFGFNIGKELGGLHLAVVLDMDNKRNADVLTVIPLSSTNNKTIHPRNVDLGSELYDKINSQYNKMLETVKKQHLENSTAVQALSDTIKLIEASVNSQKDITVDSDTVSKVLQAQQELAEKQRILENDITILERNYTEIQRLSSGSMAIINQITTVSKQRIYAPKKATDFLHGICLSPATMNKINNKLKELK